MKKQVVVGNGNGNGLGRVAVALTYHRLQLVEDERVKYGILDFEADENGNEVRIQRTDGICTVLHQLGDCVLTVAGEIMQHVLSSFNVQFVTSSEDLEWIRPEVAALTQFQEMLADDLHDVIAHSEQKMYSVLRAANKLHDATPAIMEALFADRFGNVVKTFAFCSHHERGFSREIGLRRLAGYAVGAFLKKQNRHVYDHAQTSRGYTVCYGRKEENPVPQGMEEQHLWKQCGLPIAEFPEAKVLFNPELTRADERKLYGVKLMMDLGKFPGDVRLRSIDHADMMADEMLDLQELTKIMKARFAYKEAD